MTTVTKRKEIIISKANSQINDALTIILFEGDPGWESFDEMQILVMVDVKGLFYNNGSTYQWTLDVDWYNASSSYRTGRTIAKLYNDGSKKAHLMTYITGGSWVQTDVTIPSDDDLIYFSFSYRKNDSVGNDATRMTASQNEMIHPGRLGEVTDSRSMGYDTDKVKITLARTANCSYKIVNYPLLYYALFGDTFDTSAFRSYDRENLIDHMIDIEEDWEDDGFEMQKITTIPEDPVKISVTPTTSIVDYTTKLSFDMSSLNTEVELPEFEMPKIDSPVRQALPTGFKWLAFILDPITWTLNLFIGAILGFMKGIGEGILLGFTSFFSSAWEFLVDIACHGILSWLTGNKGTVASWIVDYVYDEDFQLPVMNALVDAIEGNGLGTTGFSMTNGVMSHSGGYSNLMSIINSKSKPTQATFDYIGPDKLWDNSLKSMQRFYEEDDPSG
jgi:hypothetical protein